jgi:hypothetical protein
MKKTLILTAGLFFGIVSLNSCTDKAAEERAKFVADSIKADSIAKVEAAAAAHTADSIAAAEAAAAASAQAVKDSLAADSVAKAAKGGKKK